MSWHTTPPPIRDDENEIDLKLRFAEFWAAEPGNVWGIGKKVFTDPTDVNRATQAQAWQDDPIVLAAVARFKQKASTGELSVQDKYIAEVSDFINDCESEREKLAALRLKGEALGVVGRTAPTVALNVNNTSNVTKNVLVVPHMEMETFRAFAAKQQAELMATAKTIKKN